MATTQRKSFKAVWNKFNILCTILLLSLSATVSIDVYYVYYNTYIPNPSKPAYLFFSNFFADLAVSCYLLYVYIRSDFVLWGNRMRLWVQWVVYGTVTLLMIIPVIDVFYYVSPNAFYSLVISVFSRLTSGLTVGLDLFYTIVFAYHVYQTKKIFHKEKTEKDIVAQYGLLCTLSSLISFGLFVFHDNLTVKGEYILLVSRFFMICSGLGLTLMKMALFNLKGKPVTQINNGQTTNKSQKSQMLQSQQSQSQSKSQSQSQTGSQHESKIQIDKTNEI